MLLHHPPQLASVKANKKDQTSLNKHIAASSIAVKMQFCHRERSKMIKRLISGICVNGKITYFSHLKALYNKLAVF